MTWIKESLFRKMNLREQAKFLIHERLHAVAGNIPLGPIADMTDGIEVMLSLYIQQAKGLRPILSEFELQKLNQMKFMIENIPLNKDGVTKIFVHDMFITRNGGGMVSERAKLSENTYVGVGSIIGSKVETEGEVEIIHSELCTILCELETFKPTNIRIFPGVKISGSKIPWGGQPFEIHQNVTISNSIILSLRYLNKDYKKDFTKIVLNEDSNINNSVIADFYEIELNNKSLIKNVSLRGYKSTSFSSNLKLINDQKYPYKDIAISLKLGDGAQIISDKFIYYLEYGGIVEVKQPWYDFLNKNRTYIAPVIEIMTGTQIDLTNKCKEGDFLLPIVFVGRKQITSAEELCTR